MPAETCIYLVRHAQAAASSASGDAGRALTPEGRRAFAALVAALAPQLEIRRVLTSPYARARETAALLAAPFGIVPEDEIELASGASDGIALLALARRVGSGAALVGHNPEMAAAIAKAGGRAQAIAPGTIAAVEFSSDGACALRWLRAP